MMIIGFIPSRLESKRIFQKPLLKINGLPIIIHTMKRAMLSKKLNDLYVCTNSEIIANLVLKHGGKPIITSSKHKNGTERIAEAAKKIKFDYAIDIQGDEPLVEPSDIDKVISFHLKNKNFDIVVPYLNIKYKHNPNNVKILSNSSGKVLYFTRSLAPFLFNKNNYKLKKHLSIISFKKKTLFEFSKLQQGELEKIEGIELMRALENNLAVGTFKLKSHSLAIDVKSDIAKVKKAMKEDKIAKKYL